MPTQRQPRRVRSVRYNQIGFALLAGGVFFGLLIYGRSPVPAPALPPSNQAQPVPSPSQTLAMRDNAAIREDTAIPGCESFEAIEGIKEQLMRTETVRISGLSNVQQTGVDRAGGHSCSALVDLDFGTKPVLYMIRHVPPGKKTWELEITGP